MKEVDSHISNKSELLTPKEVAERLRLGSPRTLETWRYSKRYELPYIKMGRLVRYRAVDVIRFIENQWQAI